MVLEMAPRFARFWQIAAEDKSREPCQGWQEGYAISPSFIDETFGAHLLDQGFHGLIIAIEVEKGKAPFHLVQFYLAHDLADFFQRPDAAGKGQENIA